MPAIVVVGSAWGDEGKGKITDFLAQDADVIARYQGGDNAGHTIIFDGKKFALRSIPSGIFDPSKTAVIGNGLVLNPESVLQELAYLQANGVDTSNLKISNRAQVLFSYHKKLDELQEAAKGDAKIGTTKNGIGPAYMDKVARIGLRVTDLLDKDALRKGLKQALSVHNAELTKLYGAEPFDLSELVEEYYAYGQQLKPFVTDTSYFLDQALQAGKKVLFEGAQGILLDIDHGTYPYVTSSNPIAGGVTIGAGIGPTQISEVVGIAKVYNSRVGEGPFPTELISGVGDQIRDIAHEYGVNTGRPRRIGWFDAVAMRHAARVSGLTKLSLNCLDVLSGLGDLKVAVAYELDGQKIETYPASVSELSRVQPIFETLPGWDEDITAVRDFADLPLNAQNYLKRLSELTGIELFSFAVGPDREATIIMRSLW